MSNTAWRRYARLQVLWRDVDHLATRRDEVLWRGTGIPQSPAAKEDLRGYTGNGHIQRSFQYAVGDHIYYRCNSQVIPLITTLTVIRVVVIYKLIRTENVAVLFPYSGYSVRDVI